MGKNNILVMKQCDKAAAANLQEFKEHLKGSSIGPLGQLVLPKEFKKMPVEAMTSFQCFPPFFDPRPQK